jgi:hypothetical protein
VSTGDKVSERGPRVPKGSGQDPEHSDASRATGTLFDTLGTRWTTLGGPRSVGQIKDGCLGSGGTAERMWGGRMLFFEA